MLCLYLNKLEWMQTYKLTITFIENPENIFKIIYLFVGDREKLFTKYHKQNIYTYIIFGLLVFKLNLYFKLTPVSNFC